MARHDRPLVIAHRGSSRAFPENTLAAFDAAVTAEANAIELDLQLSRDGIPVAYHDRTLQRIDGSRDRIAQLKVQELGTRDFGAWFDPRFAGERIPQLSEILERYGGNLELFLELKIDAKDQHRRTQLSHAVVDRIHAQGAAAQVWILSFDRQALEAAQARAPELRYVLNMADPRPPDSLPEMLRSFDALCLPGRHMTGRLGAALRACGKRVFAYRCDTIRTVRRVLRAKVDGLLADDPAWLAEAIACRQEP